MTTGDIAKAIFTAYPSAFWHHHPDGRTTKHRGKREGEHIRELTAEEEAVLNDILEIISKVEKEYAVQSRTIPRSTATPIRSPETN